MFGDHAPYESCFASRQPAERDELGRVFDAADTHLCLATPLEDVNVRRFVIGRPNDELKAVDEKDCRHERIIPVRLGLVTPGPPLPLGAKARCQTCKGRQE